MSPRPNALSRARALLVLLGTLVLLPLSVVLSAAPAQADATAFLSGSVVDGAGTGVDDALVETLEVGDGSLEHSVSTTASGTYDGLWAHGPGSYHVRVSKAGFTTEWLGGAAEKTVVDVDELGQASIDGEPVLDNELPEIQLTAATPRAVTGDVRDADTDAALPGIEVSAYPTGDHETAIATDTTAADGTYELSLFDGGYDLRFEDPDHDYVATWYGGAEPTELTVSGATVVPTVEMSPPAPGEEFPVAGVVVDALGAPIDTVGVAVTPVGGSTDTGNGSTDAEGAYAVSVLPGTYQVAYSRTGFVSTTYGGASPSTVTVAADGTLSVAPAEDLQANHLGDVVLASSPYAIQGSVQTTGGDGIAGITVRAFPAGSTDPGEVVDPATSGSGGGYTLDLPVGHYDLELVDDDPAAPTYVSGSLSDVQIGRGGVITVGGSSPATLPAVQLALSSLDTPHPVVGSVVDVNGAEVDGLTVSAAPQGSGEAAGDTTGADGGLGEHGRYRLLLKPGSYQVDVEGGSAWADASYTGEGTSPATVTVQLNGTVLVNGVEAVGGELGSTVVEGTTTYPLSGSVTEDSTPLSGITVTAYAEDAPTVAVAETTSNGDGTWSLTGTSGLVVGSYLIELSGTAGGVTYDRAFFGGSSGTPVVINQGGVATVSGAPLDPANTLPAVSLTRSSEDTPHAVPGQVVDANGDPLAGVTVTPTDGPTTTTTTTDEDGAYTLHLKPGTYHVGFTKGGFTGVSYPGGGAATASVVVEIDGTVKVGSTTVASLEPVELEQSTGTATVAGRVVASSGPGTSGINGITVEVFPLGDTSGPALKQTTTSTVSAVAGSWSVTALPIGTYTVRFTDADGTAPTYIQAYYGGADLASSTPVKVGQGNAVSVNDEPKSGGDLGTTTLTASSADTLHPVTGSVVDANGDPLPGATVTPTGPTTTAATSDAEGAFTLHLKAGTYTLSYAKSGFTTTTFPGSGEETVTVTVQPDGVVKAGADVVPGGQLDGVTLEQTTGATSISGTVRSGGTGVGGITVEVFPEGAVSGAPLKSTTTAGTGSVGTWTVTGLRIGTYTVRFSDNDGAEPTYVTTTLGPVKVGQGTSDNVFLGETLKPGGALGDTTITVATASTTYDVTGSVSDANDEPLDGVTVSAEVVGGGATATSTTTDAEGAFTLELTKGTYRIRFSKTGFTSVYLLDVEGNQAQVVVAAGGGVTIGGETVVGNELDPVTLFGTVLHDITGTVTDDSALPVGGITVSAVPDAEGNLPAKTTTTASNGTFTLKAPLGSYQIRFDDNRSGSPSPRYQVTYYGTDEATRVRVTEAGLVHVAPNGSEHGIAGLGGIVLPVADSNTRYDLSGTTYDEDYEPLSDVTVTAVPVAGTPAGNGGSTTSGPDGSYTVPVKAGRYRLRFQASGYETTYLTGDDPTVPLTVVVSPTGVISAPDYADFTTPIEVQLLLAARPYTTKPKLSGKVAVGQTVTASYGALQGTTVSKDDVWVDWFLDGKPADDYTDGNQNQKFKVTAAAATKKLTFRVTISDPEGLRAPSVFASSAVSVPKATSTVTGKVAKGRLTVTVAVPTLPRPLGTVVVKDGKKKIATIKLTAKSKGKAVLKLPKLKRGKHKLTLTYSGTATVAGATKVVKVTIAK